MKTRMYKNETLSTHLHFNPPNRTQVAEEVQHKVAHVLDLDAGALAGDLCRGVEEARGRVLFVEYCGLKRCYI